MELEKARAAAGLIQQHTVYENAVRDFQAVYAKSPSGVTEVTIPRKWLPALVELAKREIVLIEEQLSKL